MDNNTPNHERRRATTTNYGIPGAHSQGGSFVNKMNASATNTEASFDMSIDPSSVPPTIPLESDYFAPRIPEPGRKQWAIPVILMAVTTVLAIIIPVAVVLGRKENSAAHSMVRHTPPPLPVKHNMTLEELNRLIPGLGQDTLDRILQDELSPQNLALDWVVGDPYDWDAYSDERKLQRYVLAVFFYAFEGPSWGDYNGMHWNKHHIHECQYIDPEAYGNKRLQLCNDQEQVVAIDLSKLSELVRVRGAFPPEMAYLSHLQVLNFTGTQLKNSIDRLFEEILQANEDLSQTLPSLTTLVISDSGISGSLPSSLATLTSLETLKVSENNHLKGTIPSEYGLLTYLHTLYLSSNGLTGSIPTELGELSLLNDLVVKDNELLAMPIPKKCCLEEPRRDWLELITDWCVGVDECCTGVEPTLAATEYPNEGTPGEPTKSRSDTDEGTTIDIFDEGSTRSTNP